MIDYEKIDIAAHNLKHVLSDFNKNIYKNYIENTYLTAIKKGIEELIKNKEELDASYFNKIKTLYEVFLKCRNPSLPDDRKQCFEDNLIVLEELNELILEPKARIISDELPVILIIDDELAINSDLRESFCRKNSLLDITDKYLRANSPDEKFKDDFSSQTEYLKIKYGNEFGKKRSYSVKQAISKVVFLSGIPYDGKARNDILWYLEDINILNRFNMSKFSAIFVDMIFEGENLGNKIMGILYDTGINRSTEIFILSQIAKNKNEIKKRDFNKAFLLSLLNRVNYRNELKNKKAVINKKEKVSDILSNITWKEFDKFAKNNEPILIMGETGTGKEIIAREIWKSNTAYSNTFLAKNLGEISDNGMKDFAGTVKASYTDAVDKKGWFELAEDGILLLDEIADLNNSAQKSLLRIIQEKEITPVGYVGLAKKVNTKLVFTTNKDLNSLIQSGKFRKDLYYRISLQIIRLKPLRERSEKHFKDLFKHFMKEYHYLSKNSIKVKNVDFEYIKTLNWEGNVREFEFLCKRALILSYEKLDKENIDKLLNL